MIPTEILEIENEDKKLSELSSITGFKVTNKHISKKGKIPNYDVWINAHNLETVIYQMEERIKRSKINATKTKETRKPKRKNKRTV